MPPLCRLLTYMNYKIVGLSSVSRCCDDLVPNEPYDDAYGSFNLADVSGPSSALPAELSSSLGTVRALAVEDARERFLSWYGASGVGRLVGGGRVCSTSSVSSRLFCVSVLGQGRDVVQVQDVQVGNNVGNACVAEDADSEGTVSRVRHPYPIESVHVSSGRGQGGGDRAWMMVAAREVGGVGWYRVGWDGVPVGMGRHGMTAGSRTRDFSWSQFGGTMSDMNGVVLDDDGMLWEIAVELPAVGRGTTRLRTTREGDSAFRGLGARVCEASPLHPRVHVVGWEECVVRVDFREGQRLAGRGRGELCNFGGRSQFVTAVGVPSRSVHPSDILTRVAVSTSSHVYLYDMRRLGVPVVSWEHGMKYPTPTPSTSSAKHGATLWELRSCFPDGLQFLCVEGDETRVDGGRVLMTNSWSGSGMVCEWRVAEASPIVQFDECDGKGRISTVVGECISEMGGNHVTGDWFSWQPKAMERLEAVEPPRLLYNAVYPPGSGRADGRVPSLRDFGCCVVDDGSTLIRYGTLGDIIVGKISSDGDGCKGKKAGNSHAGDEGDLGRAPPMFDLPIHAWLQQQAQRERAEQETETESGTELQAHFSVDPDLRRTLLYIIRRLEGVPMSAYEAWNMLQATSAADKKQDDANAGATALEASLRRFLCGHDNPAECGDVAEEDGARQPSADETNAGKRKTSVSTTTTHTTLLAHLRTHHLLPQLRDELFVAGRHDHNNHEDSNERIRRNPTALDALTPTRAFLSVWHSLSERDNVRTERITDPRRLQRNLQRLTALGINEGMDEEATCSSSLLLSTIVDASVSLKAWNNTYGDNSNGNSDGVPTQRSRASLTAFTPATSTVRYRKAPSPSSEQARNALQEAKVKYQGLRL